jgi:Uri superfamily endonuclease
MASRVRRTSIASPPGTAWVSPRWVHSLLRDNPPIVYQLLIHLDRPARIRIGSLGTFILPAGWYVYSGSARRASAGRLARHLRKHKTRRWHIDYLLARPHTRIVAIRIFPWRPGRECAVNQALLKDAGLAVPIPGFGSSDCRHACPAHLLSCPPRPPSFSVPSSRSRPFIIAESVLFLSFLRVPASPRPRVSVSPCQPFLPPVVLPTVVVTINH